MEDPDYADPVSRLNLILSVIDRLDVQVTDEHPLALLDALYTQILTSIPPSVWHTTKRILGFVICTVAYDSKVNSGLSYPLDSRTLLGASIILGLELSVVYGSFHKLHSVLQIPDSQNAHEDTVSFLHASFGDYLTDPTRSKGFYIDRGESVDGITRSLFKLYLDETWDTDSVRNASQLLRGTRLNFYGGLRSDAKDSLYYVVTGKLRSRRGRGPFISQQDRSECLDALRQVNTAEVVQRKGFRGETIRFLARLWDKFLEELESSGLFEEVLLKDIKIDHLADTRNRIFHTKWSDLLRGPTDSLRELQRDQRPIFAVICGAVPGKRMVFFRDPDYPKPLYYWFPYPY